MNNTDEHRISSNEGMRCFFMEVFMESKQQIVISDKNKVEIDMVSYVRAFDEDGVLLDTVLGRILVEGKDLKIENFEKAYPDAFKANVKMPPAGHYGDPEMEIGRVCVHLASPDMNYLTGETLTLEGGMGLRP